MSRSWGVVFGGPSLSLALVELNVTDAADETTIFRMREVSTVEVVQKIVIATG